MEKIDSSSLMSIKLTTLEVLREQESCTCFKESPSDKYDQAKAEKISGGRIAGQDLFFLFTADIIKKEVLFTR